MPPRKNKKVIGVLRAPSIRTTISSRAKHSVTARFNMPADDFGSVVIRKDNMKDNMDTQNTQMQDEATNVVDLTGSFKDASGVAKVYRQASEQNLAKYAVTLFVNQFATMARDARNLANPPSTHSIETGVNSTTTVFRDVTAEIVVKSSSGEKHPGVIQAVQLDEVYRVSLAAPNRISLGVIESEYRKVMEQHNFYQGQTLMFASEGVEFIPTPSTKMDDAILPKETLYEYDLNVIQFLTNPEMSEITKKRGIILHGAPGCHRIGQQLLMFDGSLKNVEDVEVGDQLMGPDSRPRNVLDLNRGRGKMVEIIPVNGKPFVVNSDHILSLVKSRKSRMERATRTLGLLPDGTIDIAVNKWAAWSKCEKSDFKLFRTAVEFPESEQPIDPYFLGLMLGDGAIYGGSVRVTTMDDTVVDELFAQSKKLGIACIPEENRQPNRSKNYRLSKKVADGNGKHNPLITRLKSLGLYGKNSGSKFIPRQYKVASSRQRLELLAGLMDSDGSYTANCFDFISKSEILAKDVAFVARSLGFYVAESSADKRCQTGGGGIYHRLCISGCTDSVPTRIARKQCHARKQIKDCLRTGFSIKRLMTEDFYGFTLDGDGRYLLDDFTVTHNTGKTTSVKAMFRTLKEKKITCVHVSDASFSRYSVEDVFSFINQYLAPCLIAFEDIDLVAADRRTGNSRIIGPLLSAMNGIEEAVKPTVILATTNRPEVLDAAITRPCRFDRKIKIDFPTTEELNVIFKKVAGFSAPDGLIQQAAKEEKKLTGAHVEEIYRTAALTARRRKCEVKECVVEAIETVKKHFMLVSPKTVSGFANDDGGDAPQYSRPTPDGRTSRGDDDVWK